MNSNWISFLDQAGAIHEDHHRSHFGDPLQELKTALSGTILCDLSSQGLIAVSGPDAPTFLQGQLTNDIRQVTPEHSQLSAYCSPKGRMLTTFRVFLRKDSYFLILPRENLEFILKRLRLFVLRAKVTLEDVSDNPVRLGLAGPAADEILRNILGVAPEQVDQVSSHTDLTVIRVRGPETRFEIHGELEALQALWTRLATQAIPVSEESWRLLDILAGIPTVYPETSDAFVPQMTNLQLLNGVSFQKGCYTGQEVVARTHYLGKLKRQMYRVHVTAETPPTPGTELFSPQAGKSQSAGKIVSACRHPEGGYEALAVVLSDCAEHGTVLLGDKNGPALEFRILPYSFQDKTDQR